MLTADALACAAHHAPPSQEEAWAPLNVLVKGDAPLLQVKGGVVAIPTAPGLGIDVDEAAVERYRVAAEMRASTVVRG